MSALRASVAAALLLAATACVTYRTTCDGTTRVYTSSEGHISTVKDAPECAR